MSTLNSPISQLKLRKGLISTIGAISGAFFSLLMLDISPLIRYGSKWELMNKTYIATFCLCISFVAYLLIQRFVYKRLLQVSVSNNKMLETTRIYLAIAMVIIQAKFFNEALINISTKGGFVSSHSSLISLFVATIALWFSWLLWGHIFILISKIAKIIALSKFEKNIILAFTAIISTGLFIAMLFTNVYTGNNSYDIAYSLDTGYQLKTSAMNNPSADANADIRHPLFTLFSMPVGIVSKTASNLLWFVPNSQILIFQTVMIFLVSISATLIYRMFGKADKILYVSWMTLYMFAYSTTLFCMFFEMYVQAVFFGVLLLYLHYIKYKSKALKLLAFAGSSMNLITSSALGLLFTEKTIKTTARSYGKVILATIGLLVIGGKAILIRYMFNDLGRFIGVASASGVTLTGKIYQYINFCACSITSGFHKEIALLWNSSPSYSTPPVTSINALGLTVLILAIAGYILNYNKFIAKVSLVSILFSFFLLVIAGWGSGNNEMALYSFYFGWAFIILIFMGLYAVLKSAIKPSKTLSLSIFAVCLFISGYNIYQTADIFRFGVTNYPTVRAVMINDIFN